MRQVDTSFGGEEYEHNNECRAVEVIGQDRSSEVVVLFLEDWELGASGIELPHGNGLSLPRNEGCALGGLRVAGPPSFTVITVQVKFSFGTRHSNRSLSFTVDGL